MEPLVSVIVPIYKVEQFLPRCVDSILGQTYQNLEVILVDDGSPDGCGALCDRYAGQDERVMVIHQENGGPSRARNAGLEQMTGDYLTFVDSDDYLAPTRIFNMVQAAKSSQADLVVCNYSIQLADRIDENHLPQILPHQISRSSEIAEHFRQLFVHLFFFSIWKKLYRVDRNMVSFLEHISLGEDLAFDMQYYTQMRPTVFHISDTGYFYDRANEGSIMRAGCNHCYENFAQVLQTVQAFLSTFLSPQKAAQEYRWCYTHQLIYETQLLLLRTTGAERRHRLEEYILNEETQSVLRHAEPKSEHAAHRLAIHLLRRGMLGTYIAVTECKRILYRGRL